MFRKLIFLALLGGAIAYLLKQRGGSVQEVPATPVTPQETAAARPDQPEQAAQEPVEGAGDHEESVIPDTSADDPFVREQEEAARADAAAVGGTADTVTSDVEPEMRPVVEGSGDAPETFETTEDQGR
jgi:hypothetical protein